MSMIQRANEEGLGWSCPVCGTFYFCIGAMRFCPACKDKKDKLEQEYWDRKRDGMRSIANDIVAKTLAQIGRKGD